MGALTDLAAAAVNAATKFIPDPQAKLQYQLEVERLAHETELAQLTADTQSAQGQVDINKIEAASPSLFVSGWRPFIGWVCGVALLYTFFLRPVLNPWIVKWAGMPMEALDATELTAILTSLLGLGGYRTFEKFKGVA